MSNYITPNYKMERFIRGSYYSAASDYRRFVTMDYNTESYVGIVGVGIIEGWTIEHVSGLDVQILPGRGIIDGFYSESPYTIEQRSDMVAGDREVEVLPDKDGIPEPPLTIPQRATYVSVVRLYDPTYNPVGDIENSFVKVVVPTVKTLYDNADNYIFATRPAGALPYPKLDDLSVQIALLGNPPERSAYPNYNTYKVALNAYDAKLQVIYNYEWYTNPDNHFTAVQFDVTTSPIPTSSQVLLGKVVTRSGNVSKIDVSGVDSLAGLQSKIREFASQYIVAHRHGGTQPFDPPQVRLETDKRDTSLLSYDPTAGMATFSVLERDYTSITLGHKHTYKMDSDGNGYTIDQIGNENSHIHKIVAYVVQSQQTTLLPVESHIHTVTTSTQKADTWSTDSRFVVYLNGNWFADETSTYVTTDPVKKQITLNRGVSEVFKTYSSTFTVNIASAVPPIVETFSYTGKAESVYRFMNQLMLAFYAKYRTALQWDYRQIYLTGVLATSDPFVFYETSGNILSEDFSISIVGYDDIVSQSQSANVLLKEEGDQFLFTPNAARDIPVTLVNKTSAYSDVVTIEFLDNTEVTGTLRPENITYIKAEKILTGEFEPDVIPFISHIGRLQDRFSPFQYSLVSNDGIRYTASPSITEPQDDHYHRMQLDKSGNGTTTDTMVAGEVAYYATGPSGTAYFVAHTHSVSNFIIQASAENSGLLAWQNDLHGTSETTSVHSHVTIYPSKGNNKIVYSVKEDPDGNIYAGTSDGFMMIPSSASYVYVLNGHEFNMVGTDLWQLLIDASAQYEVLTDKQFVVTEEIYGGQITEALQDLTVVGDSVLMYGQNVPDIGQDIVMIKRIDHFKMSNFKYVATKDLSEILPTETVIGQKTVRISDGVEVDPAMVTANAMSTVKTMYIVERDFQSTPIWSMDFRRVTFPTIGSSSSSSSSSFLSTSSSSSISGNSSASSSSSSSSSFGIITSSSSSTSSSNSSSSSSIIPTSSSSSSFDSSSSETSSSQSFVMDTDYVDILTVGSDVIAKNRNLSQNTNKTWQSVSIPFSVGVLRKIFKATNGDFWLSTNNGVMVSRSHNEGDIFTIATQPGVDPNIKDVVEGDNDNIYCASSSGIFKTVNEGKTWSKIFSVLQGFNQMIRDYSVDKSNIVSGHYHDVSVDSEGNGILETSIGTGVAHTHVVAEWVIDTTLSHTHNLVVTFYAVGNDKKIWKSIDSGVTWAFYVSLPDGECGEIFAAFDKVFVSQSDGLYRYDTVWVNVLEQKVYSYGWNYDMSEFFVGCNNVIYSTPDGSSFGVIHDFDGMPALILLENDSRKNFGYAYSSETLTFHFRDLFITSDPVVSLVDFNRWYDSQGAWPEQTPYQIYIDDRLILSTQYNKTNRVLEIDKDYRDIKQQYFTVHPVTGLLNFSVSTLLVNDINIYDLYVDVRDSTGLYAGDTVLISDSIFNGFFDTISAVNGNEITLSSRSTQLIALPATLVKIPSLTGDSDITANIYDSVLSNSGTLTHDQVEDHLSIYSDGRPYKLNDTYLSNLLQLTQAIRYVYPDINSEFKNDVFYDFRYDNDPSSPYYVGNFIDLLTSELYNKKIYDNNFVSKKSRSINKILFGYERFANTIIVATDIGIFWAVKESNYQANWFYVNDLPFAVYDLILFKGEKLIAATIQGTYYTDDMKVWTLDTTSVMNYPSTAISLRWHPETTIQIPIHDAIFSNPLVDPSSPAIGAIEATVGVPYIPLSINTNLNISGAGEKNGDYLIKSIENGGSKITVTPPFTGPNDTKFGVVMKSGNWWQEWNTDISTFNSLLTNALLIGGADHISYNNYDAVWKWYDASVTPNNFTVKEFMPLSSGNILAAATGNGVVASNYLMESNDIGRVWQTIKQFDPISGSISSASISEQNNSVLVVAYSIDSVYADGVMDQRDIILYRGGSVVRSGKVIGNDGNTITVFGNAFRDEIGLNVSGVTFAVQPFKINTMVETTDNAVWFGTNTGIYHDKSTITVQFVPKGSILGVGIDGVVGRVDISGNIISMGQNALNGNSILRVSADVIIRENEMVGKLVYITDVDPVENYAIVSNFSTSVDGETSIEIKGSLTSSYVGKRFKLVGNSSRIYVTFGLPAQLNEFNGGTLYVTSNQAVNYGKKYVIKESSQSFIDLEEAIIPVSTLIGSVPATNSDVVPGQSVKAIEAGDRLKLWVSMDRNFNDNTMSGLGFKVITTSSNAFSLSSMAVYSNTPNSVTLNTMADPLLFSTGDSFELHGVLIEPLPGFNHKITSTEFAHYHNLTLLNNTVSGTIQSFGTVNDSYVVLNVMDTVNFSDPIVQLSGDLFTGGEVVFRNANNFTVQYTAEIVSHDATSITVYKGDVSNWNFTGYDISKTSAGWNWYIDGTNYGYTQGTVYDDFIVMGTAITADATLGSYSVKVESSTGMLVGDKIRIQDDHLSFEINHVASVVDINNITVTTALSRTYFIENSSEIKVLRDVFPNTHIHQVRNNEIQILSVLSYIGNGYPLSHSHRSLSLIPDVWVLLNNQNMLAAGSRSIIYSSNDYGNTWTDVVDLNQYLNGADEVEGISEIVTDDGNMIAGTTNGNIFVEKGNGSTVVRIIQPEVMDSSSSSSTESSESTSSESSSSYSSVTISESSGSSSTSSLSF